MVWGVEMCDHKDRSAAEWANAFVLACYVGDGPTADGIHLLGPLAKKVVRVFFSTSAHYLTALHAPKRGIGSYILWRRKLMVACVP